MWFSRPPKPKPTVPRDAVTPIDQCDEDAAKVARAYRALGVPAFVIRTTPAGSVSAIGPALDGFMVAKMLRAAADAYEERARKVN